MAVAQAKLEIVGFAARSARTSEAPVSRDKTKSFHETTADALARLLTELGVEYAFGLVGGANAPVAEAIARSPIEVVHCRHEGGAAFAAVEAHFASRKPTAIFLTTGPGFLNALTGIACARWEGAKIIVITGVTSARQRGRWATQETSSHTMPVSGLFTEGPLFDYAETIENVAQLEQVAAQLKRGLSRHEGFVAHIAVPIGLQTAQLESELAAPDVSVPQLECSPGAVKQAAELLQSGSFALWVGFGARRASGAIRELVERTGAPVLSSPRGKGIVDENHPLYIGVTGVGGHDRVHELMKTKTPDRLLVLGTRMGESTSFWDPALVPPEGFVHVDVDPAVFGAAYPRAKTVGIQADVDAFVRALLEYLPRDKRYPLLSCRPAPPVEPRSGLVRPSFLMRAVQKHVVDATSALVMAESGNSFAWANNQLRFNAPGRYRVSTAYGSMGHFASGVLGAALGRRDKAVVLVGDGALLMNNEINTAVRYGAPAVWIVLNDARYGMVYQGMSAQGFAPVETELPPTNFAEVARAMGADGVRVSAERELGAALDQAMAARGPFVVDVIIDPDEKSPLLRRIESLMNQGAVANRGDT